MLVDTNFMKDEKPRLNARGELFADIRISRYGIYEYTGSQVGYNDEARRNKIYKIYRSPKVVMDKAAVASFAGIAITDGHPPEMITTYNRRKYQIGETGNQILRDGEYLVVKDCKITDAKTIQKVIDGLVEVSCGYYNKTTMEAGTTDEGEPFDGTQERLFGNHLSLVPKGRAGSQCRVILDTMDDGAELWTFADEDAIKPDTPEGEGGNKPRNPNPKKEIKDMSTQTFDIGLVKVTTAKDDAGSVIDAVKTLTDTHQKALDAQETAHKQATDTAAETHKAELKKATDEIAALKKQVTPEAINDQVALRTTILKVADAKKMTLATDGCDNIDLMRQVIDKEHDKKDFSKDWSIDRCIGAFEIIENTMKDEGGQLRSTDTGTRGSVYDAAIAAHEAPSGSKDETGGAE